MGDGLDHSSGGAWSLPGVSLERGIPGAAPQDRAPVPLSVIERSNPQHPHDLTSELPPIGTTIVYKGHAYRFCGVTPASIQPTAAVLQDLRTGAWTQVPVALLAARPQGR
jgi:hypothetical protein